MKTKKRFLSILLSLVLVLGMFPGMSLTAYAAGTLTLTLSETQQQSNGAYQEVSLTDIQAGDKVIVTITNNADETFGLGNNNGTSKAPDAVSLTISDDKLTGSDQNIADCTWTVGRNGDSLTFSTGDGMLCCTSSNNGVRVGSNDNTAFEIKD